LRRDAPIIDRLQAFAVAESERNCQAIAWERTAYPPGRVSIAWGVRLEQVVPASRVSPSQAGCSNVPRPSAGVASGHPQFLRWAREPTVQVAGRHSVTLCPNCSRPSVRRTVRSRDLVDVVRTVVVTLSIYALQKDCVLQLQRLTRCGGSRSASSPQLERYARLALGDLPELGDRAA
jgi:hypothetical protein